MNAELTIAIPYYRNPEYLAEALASALEQSRPGCRLLVCDDSEQEAGARELVSSLCGPTADYIRNEPHLGMVRNWNQCIDRAQTDLVCLLHADDRLHPEYVELVLGLADRHRDAAGLFCAASIIDQSGTPRFSTADAVKRFFVPRGDADILLHGEAGLRRLMAGNFIMCPTLCLRKSGLGDRRFSERWQQVQDLEFTSRLLMDGDTLVGSRRVGYAYRRHPDNATARQSESLLRFDEEFRLFQLVAERAAQLGWSGAAEVSRRTTIVKLHLVYKLLRDLATGHPSRFAGCLRLLLRHIGSAEP